LNAAAIVPGALHVFTCASVNYLPKVRLLCRSIRRHHPEATIHLALADERPPWLDERSEPFDRLCLIGDLDIPDWRAWTFKHSIVELSTAIKPFALKRLLGLPGCEKVLYFDPDMVLFSRVDDILAALDGANVALTPHQTKPERTLDAVLDNEVASLKHGVFNLGFAGVRASDEGRRFADWWSERTYHLCRAEVNNGLFTDQKWINLAPVFFDGVAILKSSRHNVATWNLTTRRFEGDFEHGFRVDGEPLGFYHFTGFDSGAHRIMAAKNASESPAVANLIAWYERETSLADERIAAWRWAYGHYDDGTPIEAHHRWLYRDHRDLQLAFPDPYATAGRGPTFLGWCNTEGRLRYPELFEGRLAEPPPPKASVPLGAALRLVPLLLSPHAGRAMRARLRRMLRSEGIAGVARRLRRHGGSAS
jgi:hypothetical protein